jgi:phosphatidylinositol alpha 1,6-mannosyltransferase
VPSKPWPRNKPLRLGLPTPAVAAALETYRPDVMYVLNPYLMGGRALAAARDLDLPSVALYFTDVEMIAGPGASEEARRRASQQLANVHGLATINLAPTRTAAADLAGHGIDGVLVWEPGVDTQAFSPSRRSRRLRAALAADDELIVGYVGRLATEKRVELLAGVAQLPGVQLVIIGGGPEATRLRAELPGARFVGPRRRQALARWYASLDVFVHCGPHETFGLTVREAQASGAAVVAPNSGGVACLIDDDVTGRLVAPHDEAAFTDAVAVLAQDRAAVKRLSAAGRAVAEARSWEAATAELVDHLTMATKL